MGSVFSPYYHWSGRGDPANHCAVNVALYGGGKARWAMTERGRGRLARAPDSFGLGRSKAQWSGGELVVSIDEIGAPVPRRIRGTVRLKPKAIVTTEFALDPARRHRWRPIAPLADIAVEFEAPRLSWRGAGYCDTNYGDEPIEAAFQSWNWSRAQSTRGGVVLYDTLLTGGGREALAVHIDSDGSISQCPELVPASLAPTPIWRIGRETRADPGAVAKVAKTLEDTPFYARSLVHTVLLGNPVLAVHESLSLKRLRLSVVKLMLPFRMPRSLW